MMNSTSNGGKRMRERFARWKLFGRTGGLVVAAGLALAPARAQDVLDNGMFTVGTSITIRPGQLWAYLLWQGTTPDLLRGRAFAVYAKAGNPASPQLYQRKAVISLTADPALIDSLVARAVNLGDDPLKLEQDVTGLFGSLLSGSLSLPQKLSAVIQGATVDSTHYQNLMVLSRLHPAVSLCLGTAFAEVMTNSPSITTYEVRGFDPTRNLDLVVLGRVTVGAQPLLLPAPGQPVEVADLTPKGHLNVKLRWATPDPLRRLALLQVGCNLWRVTRPYAEANGWVGQPPLAAALWAAATNSSTSLQVKHCNDQPVLAPRNYSDLDVLDTTDLTVFFADDDRRLFQTNYSNQVFTNGAQFYYFVTARDVLGRDGSVSPGALITLCDRLPPSAPDRVEVVNDIAYHGAPPAQDPRLKVVWTQPTNAPDEIFLGYRVYRWTNLAELHATELLQAAGDPTLRSVSELVPHDYGQARNSYLDKVDRNGIQAPTMPLDASKTFWYTVRTVKTNAGCGLLYSPHSAPVYGVLRDRTGPDAPLLSARTFSTAPQLLYLGFQQTSASNVPNVYRYRLWCAATNAGIAWAEFFRSNALASPPFRSLGRTNFPPSPGTVVVGYSVPAPAAGSNSFYCRVGLVDGRVSALAGGGPESTMPEYNVTRDELFLAYVSAGYGPPGGTVAVHESHPIGIPTNPCIKVTLTSSDPRVREWRLYRRVDEGPITLIRQETNAPVTGATPFPYDDCDLPVNSGMICYFGQVFDQQGNPSALTRMDNCLNVSGSLPIPNLFKLQPAGLLGQAMVVKWFCPPYGVTRFLVYISGDLPASQPGNLGKLTALENDPPPWVDDGFFDAYRTPLVGPGFGDGPEFQVTVNIKPGANYRVFVRAVGVDSNWLGEWSNIEKFHWSGLNLNVLTGPTVPWPALGLPTVALWPANSNLAPADTVLARQFYPTGHCGIQGVGVRIGAGFMTNFYDYGAPDVDLGGRHVPYLSSIVAPTNYVFNNGHGESLLPAALYRLQVANNRYPGVSGDVVQVSPLIEDIAYQSVTDPTSPVRTKLRDPFFTVCSEAAPPSICGLYLLDTQPVLRGARYRYFLVHFGANHEIAQIIPTNDVDVTP
jgi:hypothetical protein